MTDQKPADVLRAAAAKLREYADVAAKPGMALIASAVLVAAPNPAAMHPGVGGALADWLDLEADVIASHAAQDGSGEYAVDTGGDHALAVARQILGTQET